jgi:RNA polymerase-binding transcription factor
LQKEETPRVEEKPAVSERAGTTSIFTFRRIWHDNCGVLHQPGTRARRYRMRSVKRDLEEQRWVLSSSIKALGSDRNADHGREIVKDPYGSASMTHDDEVSFAVADRRARQLAEVTRALEDIKAGRYGTCRECGEPIAKARLKVMPFATRCVACQAQAEGLDRAA